MAYVHVRGQGLTAASGAVLEGVLRQHPSLQRLTLSRNALGNQGTVWSAATWDTGGEGGGLCGGPACCVPLPWQAGRQGNGLGSSAT